MVQAAREQFRNAITLIDNSLIIAEHFVPGVEGTQVATDRNAVNKVDHNYSNVAPRHRGMCATAIALSMTLAVFDQLRSHGSLFTSCCRVLIA